MHPGSLQQAPAMRMTGWASCQVVADDQRTIDVRIPRELLRDLCGHFGGIDESADDDAIIDHFETKISSATLRNCHGGTAVDLSSADFDL
jgi:hypothetical protein